MSRWAETALSKAESPQKLAREVSAVLARVERPAGCAVFVSGALASQVHGVAEGISRNPGPRVPTVVACGASVLTQSGQLENESAAAILAWSGSSTRLVSMVGDDGPEIGEELASCLEPELDPGASAALVFCRPEHFSPAVLEPLSQLPRANRIFGAGTVGDSGLLVVDESGIRRRVKSAALVLRGCGVLHVGTASSARLLGPLRRITGTEGAWITEIEGQSALDVLGQSQAGLPGQQLILAALSATDVPSDPNPGELLLRPIQGIDPARKGVLVTDELQPGMHVAFAIREPASARRNLEATAHQLRRSLAGATPRFGIYLSCAVRGLNLFGSADAELRILRAALGDLPLAGMGCSFEIAPHGGVPAPYLHSGVLALFAAPS